MMVTEAVTPDRLRRALLRRLSIPRNGVVVAVVIAAIAVGVVAEGSSWVGHPLLTTVNLLVSAGLIGIGSWLVAQPGQRGTGWALVLSGVARPLGLVDAWPSGPWPLYSVVFGYLDNVFAAWALLRYPEPRLSRPVRWYLGVLAGWLIGLPAVLALARGHGERSTLTPNTGTSETTLICKNTTTTESSATRHNSEPGSQAESGLIRRPQPAQPVLSGFLLRGPTDGPA